MEDIDDDFGELYADLEIQASSPINNVPSISKLCIEKTDINKESIDSGLNNLDSNGDKEERVDSGSDSEDDLNILLNDDGDSPGFAVSCGVNLRSGGYEDEEEENGGGLVEGCGSDKNRKCIDVIGCGLEQSLSCVGGGERGNGGKCGYHSQYKVLLICYLFCLASDLLVLFLDLCL